MTQQYANNPVPGGKSVPAKVLVFLAKTLGGADFSRVQGCWRMVHKPSCIMLCDGGHGRQDCLAKCRKHTSYVMIPAIAQAFVIRYREHRFKLEKLYWLKLQ